MHRLEQTNLGLKETQKQLVEDEQKKIFNATVVTTAHNLNQPLTSLLLYAELLETKLNTKDVKRNELIEYTNSIKDEINRMHS